MKVDMSAPLLDRKGEQVEEPEINARSQIVLEDGTAKSRKDFNPEVDTLKKRKVCVGHAIITALDTPDEAHTAEERRKVFMLSIKVQEAVDEKKVVTLTEDDIARIKRQADLVKWPLLNHRIYEALEGKTPKAKKVEAAS